MKRRAFLVTSALMVQGARLAAQEQQGQGKASNFAPMDSGAARPVRRPPKPNAVPYVRLYAVGVHVPHDRFLVPDQSGDAC
jgi:hypothetical protein